ncbi:MAG: hypothetical protein V1915_01125 [Candidatus Bathyarchaeota archaeon]
MISHTVVSFDPFEYFFTIGASVGALTSSLIFRQKVRPVLLFFLALFIAYFLTPTAVTLPLWALLDTYTAFIVLLTAIFFKRKLYNLTKGRFSLLLSALIGLEADILFRLFLFVPLGTYNWLYDFSIDFVESVWVISSFITPIQVSVALFTTSLIGGLLLKVSRYLDLVRRCSRLFPIFQLTK